MKYITDVIIKKLNQKNMNENVAEYSMADKTAILRYLNNVEASSFTSAPVKDAITGEQVYDANNGYTDGKYKWYRSEIYHFEKYNVALNKDFVNHVLLAS